MDKVTLILQLVIALGIFNVWILRFNKGTAYRPGAAGNMMEEFAAYGLPSWAVYLVGFLKLSFAALLVAGIWVPQLVTPAAGGMAVLMIGAIVMHLKVRDPARKALPATILLILSVAVAVFAE